MKNIILALLMIVFIPLTVKSEERICFKTQDIENILFKKDRLIFENRRNVNYSLTCKGSRHLTFQHPLIIEPVKITKFLILNKLISLIM